jgi:hypothetical protein
MVMMHAELRGITWIRTSEVVLPCVKQVFINGDKLCRVYDSYNLIDDEKNRLEKAGE